MTGLTIIDDHAWDAEHFLYLFECSDNIVEIAQITFDVQLVIRAVCLAQ